MKKIIPLIKQYYIQQKKNVKENKLAIEVLKLKLQTSKELLNVLRFNIRETMFSDNDEEINFFKYIKPKICADFINYTTQIQYHHSRSNSTNSILKNYLKNKLKKLESKKRKNLEFYRYYKQNSSYYDHLYFLRENKQLELFSADISFYLDTEFYTSHDTLAAEVVAYDLLTNFYKKEINKLKNINSGVFNDSKKFDNVELIWTASKTDIVELIYALKVSNAINSGNVNTKELTTVLSNIFSIDIPNAYKTYSEIKNRNQERTKFLNKLTSSLLEKLEYDDGL